MTGKVLAVSRSAIHSFNKYNQETIKLRAGWGVEEDTHGGVTVQHRSRVVRDPSQPNLRQVHLIHTELHEELRSKGFEVTAGEMGENITTQGINLLGLPTNTLLHIGEQAIVQVTGLRNPCLQLERIQKGLMEAVLDRDAKGNLIRKAGVMGVVLSGGTIRVGDTIRIELPDAPHLPLAPV